MSNKRLCASGIALFVSFWLKVTNKKKHFKNDTIKLVRALPQHPQVLSDSTNLNLKMSVERLKRRSHFLSLVFMTKCFTKNLFKSQLIYVDGYETRQVSLSACFCSFFWLWQCTKPRKRHTFFGRIINQKFRLIYSPQLTCEPKAKDCALSRSINIYCNSTVLAFEADHFPYIKIQLTNSLAI